MSFETRKIHTFYSKLFRVKVQNVWFKKFQIKTISLVILTETLVDVLKTWNSRITIPESVNHSIWLKYLHFSRSQNINSFSNTSFNNNIRFWFSGFLFHTFHDLVELFIFKTKNDYLKWSWFLVVFWCPLQRRTHRDWKDYQGDIFRLTHEGVKM